jgi:ketosteroid isomerase-like protein
MTDRRVIEGLLRELYAARERGDLDAACGCFTADAAFEIRGASHGSPTTLAARGIGEFRPLMALMFKASRLTAPTILALLIDGERAAVQWRARVLSNITGAAASLEFVDLVEIREGKIASYRELFVPL